MKDILLLSTRYEHDRTCLLDMSLTNRNNLISTHHFWPAWHLIITFPFPKIVLPLYWAVSCPTWGWTWNPTLHLSVAMCVCLVTNVSSSRAPVRTQPPVWRQPPVRTRASPRTPSSSWASSRAPAQRRSHGPHRKNWRVRTKSVYHWQILMLDFHMISGNILGLILK